MREIHRGPVNFPHKWPVTRKMFPFDDVIMKWIGGSPLHDHSCYFNSSPPNAAYGHQWIGSALVQIMACRLLGAKPLSQPMLGYCQLDPYEQIAMKFQSKYKTFHSRKCIWKYRLRNGGHFVQAINLVPISMVYIIPLLGNFMKQQ